MSSLVGCVKSIVALESTSSDISSLFESEVSSERASTHMEIHVHNSKLIHNNFKSPFYVNINTLRYGHFLSSMCRLFVML